MTLGPKLYFSIVLPRRCWIRFVNQSFLAGSKALVEIYKSTVSKHDLKRFSKSDILGFASAVFMDFFPPGGRLNHDDYNLEQFTNILISLKLTKHNSSFAPGFTNEEWRIMCWKFKGNQHDPFSMILYCYIIYMISYNFI